MRQFNPAVRTSTEPRSCERWKVPSDRRTSIRSTSNAPPPPSRPPFWNNETLNLLAQLRISRKIIGWYSVAIYSLCSPPPGISVPVPAGTVGRMVKRHKFDSSCTNTSSSLYLAWNKLGEVGAFLCFRLHVCGWSSWNQTSYDGASL